MGRLLEDLDTHFQSKVNKGKEEPLKISVNACHDTSIAGLCATLDVFDGQYVLDNALSK
jgi:acid phosphatase